MPKDCGRGHVKMMTHSHWHSVKFRDTYQHRNVNSRADFAAALGWTDLVPHQHRGGRDIRGDIVDPFT